MGNILIEDKMHDEEWLKTNAEKYREYRLAYLKSFIRPSPNYCPECYSELECNIDEDETVCTNCGLVTSMSIEYVAGNKICLPYGRH